MNSRTPPNTFIETVFGGCVEPLGMTREDLATASDQLESAADAATDAETAERLRDLADQLDSLATRDRGPDHGRLARIELSLDDLVETAGDDAAADIDAAHEAVVAYRETVEGV